MMIRAETNSLMAAQSQGTQPADSRKEGNSSERPHTKRYLTGPALHRAGKRAQDEEGYTSPQEEVSSAAVTKQENLPRDSCY